VDNQVPADNEKSSSIQNDSTGKNHQSLAEIWENIITIGLGEQALRIGSILISLVLILMVVWVMGTFYLKGKVVNPQTAAIAADLPTATPTVAPPQYTIPDPVVMVTGITRLAMLHTQLPTRPRFKIVEYTVVEGDTLFSIAGRYGLDPKSLLWGNQKTLPEPHWLTPGQVLNILPQDGALYEWHQGDGLNGVAKFYDVDPNVIVEWPGNNLNKETIGDYSDPNIEPGTMLFIPGGEGTFNSWSLPTVTRANPAVAKTVGAGACGLIYDGVVGPGIFTWPAATTYISGYVFDPGINHFGIDIGGSVGVAIYASDDGVVVYSGWNDFGYGNLIIIDHGNGWQTYYAHLSTIYAGCGQSVYRGDTIGLMGSTGRSTGPHLHFEMRSDTFGRVDPLNFVQH
jgi:murein DD-endopeptidase MepM/ murein hydrolase activator NlpD